MNRSISGIAVLLATCFSASAMAAPPQYALVDLGIQEVGEGLLWQGLAGHPASPSYPVPQGTSGGTVRRPFPEPR